MVVVSECVTEMSENMRLLLDIAHRQISNKNIETTVISICFKLE